MSEFHKILLYLILGIILGVYLALTFQILNIYDICKLTGTYNGNDYILICSMEGVIND